MNNTNSNRTTTMTTAVCQRCQFHPASPRIAGYCSWDCYEADDDAAESRVEDDLEGEKKAWGAALACA
jgi:hypothetical protein